MVKENQINEYKMDTSNKKISEIWQELIKICKEETSNENEQGEEQIEIQKDVILFFSFDVVNSTEYKLVNYYGWAKVLNRLFKELKREVKSRISNSEMWRVLGDEAIFIVKVKGEDELRDTINKIFEILIITVHKIKTGEFFDSTTDNKKEIKQLQVQNILSLKAAAWMAVVSNVGDVDSNDVLEDNPEFENIFEKYTSHEEYDIFEFMGNDIDTGFRIAKQTMDGRLVVSYELAYLISQRTESASCLHIITYKRLKGVWKESLYPIIWYHNPKAYKKVLQKELPLEESFPFDGYEEHELIKEYYDNRDIDNGNRSIRDLKMFTDVPFALNKIGSDRYIYDKIYKLQEMIQNASDQKMDYLKSKNLQMHCAVVCFKKSQKEIKILTAKRSLDRTILPGRWEFGGVKITTRQSIMDKVKEDYKKDFNIEINPILDKRRNDLQPVPLALYQVKSDYRRQGNSLTHKGVIILAEVIEDSDISIKRDKHECFKWVSEDTYQTEFENEKCVEDFLITLKLAFDKIKSI